MAKYLKVVTVRRTLLQTESAASMAVYRASYQGQSAYFLISPCCDRHNHQFNEAGVRLRAPSGGLPGRGDRKCRPQGGDNYTLKPM